MFCYTAHRALFFEIVFVFYIVYFDTFDTGVLAFIYFTKTCQVNQNMNFTAPNFDSFLYHNLNIFLYIAYLRMGKHNIFRNLAIILVFQYFSKK